MKNFTFITLIAVLAFTSCTKRDVIIVDNDPYHWMQTHEEGSVAYVDYYTGNYIIETNRGYAVVELWSSISPREYDLEYANFSNRGTQTIYNLSGDYFTSGRVVDSWLSWSEALYVLDEVSY